MNKDVQSLIQSLPPKPQEAEAVITQGSVWFHNVRKTQYVVLGFAFDTSNNLDKWKVLFRSINDTTFICPFVQDYNEFRQEFTKMG